MARFKFRTSIDSYTDASEMTVNKERIIKTTFSVTMNGYLIPEAFSEVVTTQKKLTPKRIFINDDVSLDLGAITEKGQDVNISVQQGSAGGGSGLENPFTIAAGTGLTVGGAGSFDGSVQQTFTFSIGQDVGTDQTVTFANISASSALHIGPTSFEISQRDDGKAQVDTDWVVLGDITAENYIVSSSITHMTQSFSSGSTIFGDTQDDTHLFTGSLAVTGSLTLNGISVQDANVSIFDTYLRKSYVKKAASISATSTASFTAVTASAPSGLAATSEQDFVFFINGQYMEHDALTIKQSASNFLLLVDTDSIGYTLESDDEIIAQGKFNS